MCGNYFILNSDQMVGVWTMMQYKDEKDEHGQYTKIEAGINPQPITKLGKDGKKRTSHKPKKFPQCKGARVANPDDGVPTILVATDKALCTYHIHDLSLDRTLQSVDDSPDYNVTGLHVSLCGRIVTVSSETHM